MNKNKIKKSVNEIRKNAGEIEEEIEEEIESKEVQTRGDPVVRFKI